MTTVFYVSLSIFTSVFAPNPEGPNSDGRVLHLAADVGVTANSQGVTLWQDQSSGGGDNSAYRDATFGVGYPQHSCDVFSTGIHSVIRFNGDAGMGLLNQMALRSRDTTIHAVVELSAASGSIFSNYSNSINWGYGYVFRLGAGPRGRQPCFFTSAGSEATIHDVCSASIGHGYHILTATMSSATGEKKLYIDGVLVDSNAGRTMDFDGSERAAIGSFREFDVIYGTGRSHVGGIAEIIVYNSVDDSERQMVEAELRAKYFEGQPPADQNFPPTALVCARGVDGTTASLSWISCQTYESIAITRNGATIATLAGAATSFTDFDVPPDSVTYKVVAEFSDGSTAGPSCRLRDGDGRQVTTIDQVVHEPTFATRSKTSLDPKDMGWTTPDPVELVRLAWNGYMRKNPEPSPVEAGDDALRFHFDSELLPWPSLKHHVVDGADTGMRTMGAHAKLREMLGAEKDDDPVEAATLAYVLDLTDTGAGSCDNSWMAWLDDRPNTFRKSCPMAQGMGCRHMRMLYEQTGDEYYREWSLGILDSLERYARTYEFEGRPTATYCWNGYNVCEAYCHECPTGDCGYLHVGWLCYITGWNTRAFSEWYEVTGDPDTLEFATALANRTCNTQFNGDDGAFRPDGSFGGTDPAMSGAWHVHGHTYVLPGLAHLGVQLIRSGKRDEGLAFIEQAKNTFDWLFDAEANLDAGSWTGWLPEWLRRSLGWPGKSDSEGDCVADAVEIAVALADAASADPTLADLVDYYDTAERIYTGQIIEATFQITPEYEAVLETSLRAQWGDQWEPHYQAALADAARFEGQLLGLCGFPDRVNNRVSPLASGLPGINMMGCCASGAARAAHAVWDHTVTGDASEARVNLALNRDSPLLEVVSSLPRVGEVNVLVKTATRVLIRVPSWVDAADVRAFENRSAIAVAWDSNDKYVVFDETVPGDQLTVTYPVRIAEVIEVINGIEYTETWRGNTIVDIRPGGTLLPMYQRRLFDISDSVAVPFSRGDCNGDGEIDISDGVGLLNAVFRGTGTILCEEACDANDDGEVDLTDAVKIFVYLFRNPTGEGLPNPFGLDMFGNLICGLDFTPDSLTCEESPCEETE
jgi:hypothetical protein